MPRPKTDNTFRVDLWNKDSTTSGQRTIKAELMQVTPRGDLVFGRGYTPTGVAQVIACFPMGSWLEAKLVEEPTP